MTAASLRRTLPAVVLVLFALKFWLAAQLPLFGDEAFYWLESHHLAPAFDDVPAATPALIALGRIVGGESTFAVRLPFLLIALATLLLFHRMLRRSLDAGVADWTVLIVLLIPLFAQNGLLALPDVPLNFAIVLCLAGLLGECAGVRGSRIWLAAGLAFGWLSHYRFLVPLGAAGLALIALPEGRALLRQRAFLVACAAGNLVGLAPLFWQQWHSHGAGFAFQFGERHPWTFQPALLGDPLLQAVITSPLLYALLLWAGWQAMRRTPAGPLRLLGTVGAAIVLLWFLLGPFVDSERSRLHWPLPGYLALAIPLAAHWQRQQRALRIAAASSAAMLVAGAVYLGVLAQAPQRLVAGSGYAGNFSGWRDIADVVTDRLETLPADSVVVADNFMLAAELQFALQRRVYSLEHPLNRKHGRVGEVARMQLDESSIPAATPQRPLLIVSEVGASRLRERSPWYARLCERFAHARPLAGRMIDGGRKRLLLWLDRDDADAQCLPPALAYLDTADWLLASEAGVRLGGWVVRGRAGVDALRARIGEVEVDIRYGLALPTLDAQIGGSRDPNLPAVGFELQWPAGLPAESAWLSIEALSGGEWQEVLRQPVQPR